MNSSQDTPDAGSDAGGSSPLFERVLDLVRFLRAHCPWDAAQTPRSLVPYMLEEAHEVADAIGDEDDELAAELGDLLLHVAFQAVLAEERGAFPPAEIVDRVEAKMRRRHPHLYGEGPAEEWETLKQREREARGRSVLSGLARGLDPLSRAHRIQERVSGVGFDWENAREAFEKVAEEVEEVREALESGRSDRIEAELGDLLFSVVNVTRRTGTHAMHALQRANRTFTRRFDALERLAAERGVDLADASLEQLDRLWNEVKRTEPSDTEREAD